MMMGYAVSLFCYTLCRCIKNFNKQFLYIPISCFLRISYNWIHCWCLAMAIDICVSFFKFDNMTETDHRMKFYVVSVGALPMPMIAWYVVNLVKGFRTIFREIEYYFLNLITLITAILLVIAAVKAFHLSRSANKSSNSRFTKEMSRWEISSHY